MTGRPRSPTRRTTYRRTAFIRQTTAFFVWLRRRAAKAPAVATIDQVIDAVARKMSVDRDRLLSSSRERRLTLTRAIIGWHVTQNRIATLTEVSRALGRDPSSVYTAYERYRAWRPKLFRDSLETILGYLTNDDPGQLLGSADRREH